MQKYSLQAIDQIRAVMMGTGRVANALGLALHRAGLQFSGVFGRNHDRTVQLANALNTKSHTAIDELPRDAHLYILAVSDDAVEALAKALGLVNGLVVHVSGSLPVGVLSALHRRYGVFYPLQTFSEERKINFAEVPFFVQAGSKQDLQLLKNLAGLLSNTIVESSDEMRENLHLAAVFVSNFVNALYGIGAELLQNQGLSFELLQPLIRETTSKALDMSPALAQTGPARRNDINTIKKHLQLLDNLPRQKAIYQEMTSYLLEKYHGNTL